MSTQLLIFFIATFVTGASAAEAIPADLAGEWATDKTEFARGAISKGCAVYIGTNGLGAIIVAPPPLGQKGSAEYNAKKHILTVKTAEGAKATGTYDFIYDPKEKTLKSHKGEFGKEYFKRRRDRVPRRVLEELN